MTDERFSLLLDLFNNWGVKEFIAVKPYGWNNFLKKMGRCTSCGKEIKSTPSCFANGRCKECDSKTDWGIEHRANQDYLRVNHICPNCKSHLTDEEINKKHVYCTECSYARQNYYRHYRKLQIKTCLLKEYKIFPRTISNILKTQYYDVEGKYPSERLLKKDFRRIIHIIKKLDFIKKEVIEIITANGFIYLGEDVNGTFKYEYMKQIK